MIILDTDIGSDVDDAMALALILGRPDLDLVGITTVYGDTGLRARLARRYLSLGGGDIAVHAGLAQPRSGRPVWWAGHEGSLHENLEREQVESDDAVGYLTRTVAADPGSIDVVAIGPLTNIAAALDSDPTFERNVRRLTIMGGSFGATAEPEHNFGSDAAAAERVFSSSIPVVVTGLEITRRVTVGPAQLERIARAGSLGAALAADIDQWWAHRNEARHVPHDPIAVLSLAEPDLFRLSGPGRITIRRDAADEGRSSFQPSDRSPARLVVDLDIEAVTEAMITAIERADGPTAS